MSPVLEPIIRFSEVKYSVREPQVKGHMAIVKIPILRVGDTSKVSLVRVHTKDGSATSGEDYNPLSEGKNQAGRPGNGLLGCIYAFCFILPF